MTKKEKAVIAELYKAAKSALENAENGIKDSLEGTSSFKSAMDKLEPIRQAIQSAEDILPVECTQ